MSWFIRCSWYGGPFSGGNCRRCTNVSFGYEFVRNPDPISYDQTPDFSYLPPQPQYKTYSCELCGNDSHYGFDCPPRVPLEKLHKALQAVCEKLNQQEQAANVSTHTPEPSRRFNIIYDYDNDDDDDEERTIPLNEITSQIPPITPKELRQLEQATNLSTLYYEPSRRFNSFYDYDDYEESTIPLNESVSKIPPSIAITPVLPTLEPYDSLIMGDEDLSTIPEKESDEVIKTSVEDLVPIHRKNLDNVNNLRKPLFEFDDEYISSDVNPLFDEVLEDIESKDSYVSNLDELALLVTPFSDANEDACFDLGGEIDEIDAFLYMDISTDIENGYHDSEGDIIYLESLLVDDTIPNLPLEVFLDHDPKNLKDEPDNEDLKSMVKVFDPEIHEKTFSPTYVKLPFEDRHYLYLTYVI
ncbi:hypothetical protein Tco_0715654 [Tanacetum coccineum]